MNANQLMNATALNGGHKVDQDSPVRDIPMVTALLQVKELILPNARVLYGSEAFKFFGKSSALHDCTKSDTRTDFVTGRNTTGKYTCVLVCSLNGHTRILRKETRDSALEAAQALADGLIRDAGDLFAKADVGDQISGQQGYRNERGRFELDPYKYPQRFSGAADDTKFLRPEYRRDRDNIPRGPAADRKRYRCDELDYD